MPSPAFARAVMRLALRLLAGLAVPAGVLLISFVLLRLLPGDPAAQQVGVPGMTPAAMAELRHDLGLDAPLPSQLSDYLRGIAAGDLGRSLVTGRPVAAELAERLPASAELTLAGFALAVLTALPLGVLAARRRGGRWDAGLRGLGALALSVPSFLTGLGLITLFYVHLGWAPEPVGRLDPFLSAPPRVSGFLTLDALLAGDGAALRSALAQLALPALTLAVFAFGPLLRLTRAAMAQALVSDYVLSARANGLSRRRIVWTYAFRNALAPVVGTMTLIFSTLLGAGVLVEKVFAWPGLGSFAVEAALSLDHMALQGVVLVMAAVFVAVNLAIDLLHAAMDPRLRHD